MLGANPLGCQPLGGLVRGLIQRLYEFLVPMSASGDSIRVRSCVTASVLVDSQAGTGVRVKSIIKGN